MNDAAPLTLPAPATLLRLAIAAEQAGKLDEAERILAFLAEAAALEAETVHLRAITAFRRGALEAAVAAMRHALALRPEAGLFHRNACELFRQSGQLDEAEAAGRAAARLLPADPDAWLNLAITLYDRLKLDEAIGASSHALSLAPGKPSAHFERGEALLLAGDYARGFEDYEHRFAIAGAAPLLPGAVSAPLWDGTPIPHGRLVLIADQGYGDAIQFARYIGWAASRAGEIVIACAPEMTTLLGQVAGDATLVTSWGALGAFHAYAALSGLPRLAGTRIDTIPAPVPYLRPDPTRAAEWRAMIEAAMPGTRRRVGLVWAGRPTHNNDRNRSLRFADLAPLLAREPVGFVSLQMGEAGGEAASYRGAARLLDLGPAIGDFDDTMGIIDGLDLVVTADTAVAHLAGAMGRTVWIMLPYAPDWRWGLVRPDTGWYPTARLFRQPAPGRWDLVAAAVAGAL